MGGVACKVDAAAFFDSMTKRRQNMVNPLFVQTSYVRDTSVKMPDFRGFKSQLLAASNDQLSFLTRRD